MIETVRAAEWIRAQLLAAPALAGSQIYDEEAPQGTDGNYIVYQYQGGADDLTDVGAARVWASLLYLVRVIGAATSYAPLKADADAIDARLHRKSGTVSGASIDSCVREQPFQMPERTPAGVAYRHLGGLYRLKVRAI